jgi:hypothetical protein
VAYFYDADERALLTTELNRRGYRVDGDSVYDTKARETLSEAEAQNLLETLLLALA